MYKLLVFFFIFSSNTWSAGSSCERAAYINFEKVLIDSSSSIKGDGLKFLLKKDPKAYEFLKLYQEKGKPSSNSAIISTAGLALGVGGYFLGKKTGVLLNRNLLLAAGLSVVLGNFIYNKTKQKRNEKNLLNAIYEYNLRNTPKIYFTPYKNELNGDSISVGIGINKRF